eukprot:7886163-Karenia_brevis.AAC.1
MLRRAGTITRDYLLQYGADPLARDTLMTTISRCIFSQDVTLAKFLIATYPLAAEFIRIDPQA